MKRISPDVKSGNTNYYLTIDSDNNKIFVATSKVSTELPLTVVGDKVKIAYQEGKSGVVDIIEFDNLNLGATSQKNKSDNSLSIEESKTENTESENIQEQ